MQVVTRPTVSARASRTSSVVVRASAESRRAVLGGFLAGVALSSAGAAHAGATPLELIDERKVKQTGYDLIYEARDEDLPISQRDGLAQARSDLKATLARVKASETRVDSLLEPSIKKSYWTEAREELRRQVGTLRFDLNTLASAKPSKAEKVKALGLKKDFLAAVEALDLALRKKDQSSALSKLTATKSALDAVLAVL